MATISFTQNVIVKDKSKIEEIKQVLSSGSSSFEHIKPSYDKNRTQEVSKIWFSH